MTDHSDMLRDMLERQTNVAYQERYRAARSIVSVDDDWRGKRPPKTARPLTRPQIWSAWDVGALCPMFDLAADRAERRWRTWRIAGYVAFLALLGLGATWAIWAGR